MVAGIGAIDADVIVLCETTMQARDRLRPLETRFLHALDTCAADSLYGIVILSKFPLTRRSAGIGEDPLPRHLAADVMVGGAGSRWLPSIPPIPCVSAGPTEFRASSSPSPPCAAQRWRI
jgi:hypothetical protein